MFNLTLVAKIYITPCLLLIGNKQWILNYILIVKTFISILLS